MTTKYKTLLTTAGAAKLAAATAGGTTITLTHMAVGDGDGTLPQPDVSQTTLINEKWRAELNKISVDKSYNNYVVAELVIPPEVGGFWMREMGLFDADGTLIAVANMAESYKPELAEGSGRAQTVRMVIMVSAIESVDLTIDTTTVMATQDYVDDKLTEHERSRRHPDATLEAKGFAQLSSATDSDSEVLAATPKAVKAAFDMGDTANKNADSRLLKENNLSDVPDAIQARQHLGLKGAAVLDTGTTAGTVAAGDDTRIVNALQKDKNLSDVENEELARENLGLKSAALCDAQTSDKDVTPGRVLVNGGTFVIGADQVQMQAGNARFQFGDNGDFTAAHAINIGDTDTGFLANGDGSAFIRANNTNIGWWDSSKFVLNTLLQANAGLQTSSIELTGGASVIDFHFHGDADDYNIRLFNNAYNQLSLQGVAANPLFNLSSGQFVGKGTGSAWGAEWGNYQTAPFNASDVYAAGGDAWCPMIKGHGQKEAGFVTSISFGFYIPSNNLFNNPVIYAKNDNGSFGWWMFNNQSGDINYANAQGSFTMATQPWVNGRVSEVQAWVNGNFCTIPQRDAKADISWVRTYFVQSIRLGASGEYQERSNNERVGGGVMTAFADRGSSNYWIRIRPLQYLINDVWYTAAYS
jgi:phage-related tail fiber protein